MGRSGYSLVLISLVLVSAGFWGGCEKKSDFAKDVVDCEAGAMQTRAVLNARGRYAIVESVSEGCRVEFVFTENANPELVDKPVTFVVRGEERIDEQLKEGVAECLKGNSGTYLCDGPLFVASGGAASTASQVGGSLPCGEPIDDEGPPLYPLPEDDKWGFVDGEGQWVIKPQWDLVQPFSEGRAPVAEGNRWGAIDRQGEYVLAPTLQSNTYSTVDGKKIFSPPLQPYSHGCASGTPETSQEPPFFVDREGNLYWYEGLPEELEELEVAEFGSFSEGLVWFRARKEDKTALGSHYGWLDVNGEIAIEPKFEGAGDFVDGLAPASLDGRHWGFVDVNGELQCPGKWTLGKARAFSEGLALYDAGSEGKKFANCEGHDLERIRLTGERSEEFGEDIKIDSAGDFSDGLAPARTGFLDGYFFVYLDSDGTAAFVPEDLDEAPVCNLEALPEYRDGLVRWLIANDGEECGDEPYSLELARYESAHYAYFDTDANMVIRQKTQHQ